MNEICYNGSHGTSLTLSNKIKETGFKLGDGRAGKGVYFWVDGPEYLKLAKDWFIDRRHKLKYNEAEPQCAIIIAKLNAQPVEYIDFEDAKLKELLYNLGVQQGTDFNNVNQIARLYNLFISKLEEKLKNTIKIITIRVAPPEGSTYPIKAIGAPLCCVARAVDSITINSIISCDKVQRWTK